MPALPTFVNDCAKTRGRLFPGISFHGHPVAQVEELFHEVRIEGLLGLLSETRRDVRKVESVPVTFAEAVYLVKVPDALCSDEGVYGAYTDWNDAAFHAPIVGVDKGVANHVHAGHGPDL